MIKDVLQGRPFRHPLHSFLVHFPIGLFTISLLLDIVAIVSHQEWVAHAASYTILAGVITALIAAVPGLVDFFEIRRDHPARKLAVAHMILNLVVVILYAASYGVRHLHEDEVTTLPLTLSVAAFGLLALSGHLGGKMVLEDGIAVGRHRRDTELPYDTVQVNESLRFNDGFVRVANAHDLEERETLRVQVGATVVVIAKEQGKLFCFQEFCTHRFGPLSEGCVHNGEIECPWHCSRFSMETGKVTAGPAKLELKTFPVRVVDGEIQVRV